MFYNFSKVTERIYHISSKESVCCDLIVGDEKALLWDTGYGFGNLSKEIKSITTLPIIVVNSHGHIDHINGNFQFEGPFYIHKEDIALAKEHSSVARRKQGMEDAKETVDLVTQEKENILPKDFEEEAYLNATMPEYQTIEEGHCFDLGGIKVEVIAFPGHTRGSIGLWCKEEEVLFTGDAFSPFVWLFAEDSCSLSVHIESLKKAKALNSKLLLMGHVPVPMPAKNLDYYLECAEQVDFEKGMPFQPPILESVGEVRICVREGYMPMQFEREGYASIAINREHL